MFALVDLVLNFLKKFTYFAYFLYVLLSKGEIILVSKTVKVFRIVVVSQYANKAHLTDTVTFMGPIQALRCLDGS